MDYQSTPFTTTACVYELRTFLCTSTPPARLNHRKKKVLTATVVFMCTKKSLTFSLLCSHWHIFCTVNYCMLRCVEDVICASYHRNVNCSGLPKGHVGWCCTPIMHHCTLCNDHFHSEQRRRGLYTLIEPMENAGNEHCGLNVFCFVNILFL